ncbi:hypothetical protein I2I05_17950 [Hymenobacter sp. BT683]|uniref:Carboxypeptidase regulatory-like domain-containing protein n=1 Tax=Hymenobacter jeongseonensis TaxID=2791027 RepID=A0ABS0ILM5_9BACT|nr:hypothetical protein [Hymenobacter jeongseonensis]MBF9239280.1 hypothetical protein [Hymenobacter jeongseonensis]
MKKSLLCCLFFLGLAAAVACRKASPAPEAAPAAAYPQTWQLVEMTGQLVGSRRTGADLPWQETYVFRADGTFLKTRRHGAQRTEARGTFAVQDLPDGRYAVLVYAAASPLIGSCTATALTETLAFQADGTLASTWQACDGPGLAYQHVN